MYGRNNAHIEKYNIATIFGREVIFTQNLIDRTTLPIGMRMYEILADDSGNPAEIAHSFIGKKFGTIITHCYIPMRDGWRIIGRRDLKIRSQISSLKEFMHIHPPKKKKRQQFGM